MPAKELSHKQYSYLKHLARKQTVEGLVNHALANPANGIRLERQDVFDMLGRSQLIARENKRLNDIIAELTGLLTNHEIPFVIVKGQTIAALMAHHETRTPGDIDFYIPPSHFQQACDLIAREWQVSYEQDEEDGEQHLAFSHDGVLLEMHYCLLAFASNKNQRIFNSIIEESFNAQHSSRACSLSQSEATESTFNAQRSQPTIPTLPTEVNLLYTFLHLYHHLVELGCGLRQFCDVAVLCHTYYSQESFDNGKLKEYLDMMDFTDAFKTIETILTDYLGLPEEECPVPFNDKDRKYAKDIMDIVFLRGNFGKYGRKTAVRSGTHYYIEQTGIKLRHYRLFYHLSSREVLASLFQGIPKKILQAIKR